MPYILIEDSLPYRSNNDGWHIKKDRLRRKQDRKWLTDEQIEWCLENLSTLPRCREYVINEWTRGIFEPPIYGVKIFFKSDEDQILFQLRWV